MDGSNTEGKVPTPIQENLSIVSPKETDSLGSNAWKEYLDKDKLRNVWSVPERSPYARFQKTKTIDSVAEWVNVIKPRYSEGEQNSEYGIANLISSGQLDSNTAVILDSGGSHSVAMAVKLAEQGYQPVIMFDTSVYANVSNGQSAQELATILYFAEQMKRLKEQGKIKPDAPPVFVLDTHRNNLSSVGKVNNSYEYKPQDFPTNDDFKQLGINKVVYLNEGNQEGRINKDYQSIDRVNSDLQPSVLAWQKAGINISYTGIRPWKPERSEFSRLGGFGDKSSYRNLGNFDLKYHPISYPDMQPEVYGKANGIAMHKNRERFVFTNEGGLMVINESGRSRAMKPEEVEQFQGEIKKRLSEQPNNKQMKNLLIKLQEKSQG